IQNIVMRGDEQIITTNKEGDKIIYNNVTGNVTMYEEGKLEGISQGEPGRPYSYTEDENGCIWSEAYLWCEEKQKCLRPWEERCKEPELDEHGCIDEPQYKWCEARQKCVNYFEEYCDEDILQQMAEMYCTADTISDVMICGDAISYIKTKPGGIPIPGEGISFYKPNSEGMYEEIECPIYDPDPVCEELGLDCVEVEDC
ncbi:hypothetical protein ACFL0W_06850, partial [Nanoarchaeota archaeon]